MPVIRDYQCNKCGEYFTVTHDSGDDPFADCPYCEIIMDWRPKSFSIRTHKSKAVDITQNILETDYGMSNFNDQQREGDIAAKMPVETTADREANARMMNEIQQQAEDLKRQNHPAMQKAVDGFFAPTGAATAPGVMNTLLASAAAGRAQEGKNYVDPIASTVAAAGQKGVVPRDTRRMLKSF